MLLLVLTLLSTARCYAQRKAAVSVMMETFCPDTLNFLRDELLPVYSGHQDRIALDIVPFGKASYVREAWGGLSFSCQHEEKECYGNRYILCALPTLGRSQALAFALCSMFKTQNRLGTCARQFGLDPANLDRCAGGDALSVAEGDEKLYEAGEKTGKLTFVPTVYIDGKRMSDQDMTRRQFSRRLCEQTGICNYT